MCIRDRGILGAVVLNAILFAIVGTTWGGVIGQLVIGVIGACILIWIGRLVRSRT